ncbi:hypothetical protein [Helicobacter sp. T3_23-1059]
MPAIILIAIKINKLIDEIGRLEIVAGGVLLLAFIGFFEACHIFVFMD